HPEKEKKEINYESTRELISPIISSTLTTVSIFLPFIFVTGMAGQLFKQLALTITFSMIASIFVALLLVPRMCLRVDLSKQSIDAGQKSIRKYFIPLLERVLRWPLRKMLFFTFLYIMTGVVIFMLIPKEFMPKVDERRFVLNIAMHPETPLKTTNEATERAEAFLSRYEEIKDLAVTVGSTGDDMGSATVESMGSYQSRIIARLEDGGLSTNEIITEMSDEMKKWNIKGMETEFITQQGLFGSNIGASSGITIEVKGSDLTKLRQRSEEIKSTLSEMPDFYGIRINPSDLVPELKVQVDRERASLFGLSTQDISAMTLAAIKGFVGQPGKGDRDDGLFPLGHDDTAQADKPAGLCQIIAGN
ncbi:MAG: efflux RND transporter permease subunit, partial [Endomicrobiales bacterium]